MPEVDSLTDIQILDKLNLVENGKLKRGAIILFAKNPNRFYPSIQVRIGRFGEDSADLLFHEVLEGNLVYLLKEVQVQLNYKFLTKSIEFEGMRRLEKEAYPIIALREMLLNALVHRTYMGAHTQMHVYDNKITLWNDGGLPIELNEEDLKREHKSKPRNPIIANACFLAGYIDTWGRGTLKIIDTCLKAGLAEPIIKELQGGIEVSIFKFDSNKELLKINSSDQIRNDLGMISERIRNSFVNETIDKNSVLETNNEVFLNYLRDNFRKASGKLRDNFGKGYSKTDFNLTIISY